MESFPVYGGWGMGGGEWGWKLVLKVLIDMISVSNYIKKNSFNVQELKVSKII